MKILIKITSEILERSKKCPKGCLAVKSCAFSLAFMDIFPDAEVLTNYIYPFGRDDFDFSTTHEMQSFIRRFDNLPPSKRVKMKPQDFELELPEWVVDRIGIKEAHEIISNSKTLELA